MRRIFGIVVVLVAAVALAVTSSGAGGKDVGRHYTVELDNAFGLVKGADLKIAGVRAGKISELRLDRRTRHALVDFTVDKTGFGSLREDATCETRPQSLIGEYFIDCNPGKSSTELRNGATIAIDHTTSTIPADLVNNILRRPYRERLRIILSQLGAGVGARGEHLNEAIRRASPALRETDRVLAILARQNTVLRDLVKDGDEVIGDIAGNRKDVTRWVKETQETASASAERRQQIAEGLQKLPAFLRELGPTMAELGHAADANVPSLRDLNASADQLENLFTSLKPFSESTQVNLRSLGGAAREGLPAVKAAAPLAAELNRFSVNTGEVGNNLSIILKDLDDRDRAVEADPRSPGGKGYTGFEAILQYVFDQALGVNIYDAHGYILKVNLLPHSECSDFQNAESLKAEMQNDPGFYDRCKSILGPNQQGVLQPDPTLQVQTTKKKRKAHAKKAEPTSTPTATPTPDATDGKGDDGKRPPIDLGQTLDDLLGKVPGVSDVTGALDRLRGGAAGRLGLRDQTSQSALLDYLLAP